MIGQRNKKNHFHRRDAENAENTNQLFMSLSSLRSLRLCGEKFLLLVLLLALPARGDDLKLWYLQPAKTWMTEALPIGNGRLGGMIFGGVAQEHIQFNEDTLWTGGPAALAGNPTGGAEHIGEIQKLMAAGQTAEATQLIQRYFYGNTRGFGAYQAFGDVLIDLHTPAEAAGATDYRRELDLSRGVARVHYVIGGVSFDREYFCSYPDGVMAMRLTCSRPGGLHAIVHLATVQRGVKISAKDNELILQGKLADNGLGYQAIALVRPEGAGAKLTATANGIAVDGGDALTILLTAATEYDAGNPTYRGKLHLSPVTDDYATLLANHEKDYTALFGRVSLDLGKGRSDLPTDERLAAYKKGAADPGLEALYFQFGRYLLISSSRAGGLPSNRQGIWNNAVNPQWGADFPTMMNLEMMYWPAETTNLAECAQPLIDLIDRVRGPGRVAAKTTYGARGWVVNFTTNPWGFTAAGTSIYQYFPAGAAWLCQHVWEHYAFSGDKQYLEKTAYPIMKEAAEFWVDHLITDADGTLVSSPSESPEHGGFVVGATMDQEIVGDLFDHCIAAAEILNVDADFSKQLMDMRQKLSALKVGRLGQLQEWKTDIDDPTDTHRHISHLFAVYPGDEIDPLKTPALAAAAEKSLQLRGDPGPGWGMAWKIGFAARLLEGDHAHAILVRLLTLTTAISPRSTAAGTYPNLFDARPPLQVDGNLAATAGMAEMLLQSQDGEIDLLPALPKAWSEGSVRGLCARGGFEVDESWRGGVLREGTIHSAIGGVCRVRSSGPLGVTMVVGGAQGASSLGVRGRDVKVRNISVGVIEFATEAGGGYHLVPFNN
jgi:alpha-L-fucosidase 2